MDEIYYSQVFPQSSRPIVGLSEVTQHQIHQAGQLNTNRSQEELNPLGRESELTGC
jgi:hypothetical protein